MRIIFLLIGLTAAADLNATVASPVVDAAASLSFGVATVPCGSVHCPISQGCGNPSCSCCGLCTQQFCGPVTTPPGSGCTTCGAPCSRPGLPFGICNKNLKCVVRGFIPPNCGGHGSCPCGTPCTMLGGGSGVCQTDDTTCAVNILPPNCGGTHCPKFPCPFIACLPPRVLETKPGPNGCPGCPRCVLPDNGCTNDSGCTNGFCFQNKCYPFSGVGEPCGGFILPPKRCEPGLRCQMNNNIPDLPGKCVRRCPPCPLILCPPIATTLAAAPSPSVAAMSADVSTSAIDDFTIGCPPCRRC